MGAASFASTFQKAKLDQQAQLLLSHLPRDRERLPIVGVLQAWLLFQALAQDRKPPFEEDAPLVQVRVDPVDRSAPMRLRWCERALATISWISR